MNEVNMKYWKDWEEESHSWNTRYSGPPIKVFLTEQVQTILLRVTLALL